MLSLFISKINKFVINKILYIQVLNVVGDIQYIEVFDNE